MSYRLTLSDDGATKLLPESSPLRIAVLISGSGTTLKNLLNKIEENSLPIEIACVISSSAKALGLNHASDHQIPSYIKRDRDCSSPEDYRDAIFDVCREHDVAIVVMGGFLRHVLIPQDFEHRVINIHPSLIPSFSGKGFYGRHVHESVLEYGCKLSGCTVHFVDNEYDHGPIILQRSVPVIPGDSPEELAARVFAAECEAYPEVLTAMSQGRVRISGRNVEVLPAE